MESISTLREKCQASKQGGDYPSPYVRLGRKFSIYLTWLLLHTPLSANQVTLLGTFIGLIGAGLLVINQPWVLIAGVVLLQLSYILDFSDGEIARYRDSNGSMSGAYLDFLYHYYVPFVYMGALAIGAYLAHPRLEILALGIISCIGVSQMHFFCKEHILIARLRVDPKTVSLPTFAEAMKDAPALDSKSNVPVATWKSKLNRFTRFLGELLLYPYSFNLITLLVIADILASLGQPTMVAPFRTVFLCISASLLSLQTLKRVRYNFLVLKTVDHESRQNRSTVDHSSHGS